MLRGNHRRTKHTSIEYHYIRELGEKKQVDFNYVPTAEILADGLNNRLGRQLLERLISTLGLAAPPAGCV